VLEEGDQDNPVVDPVDEKMGQRWENREIRENKPEVRSQVSLEHVEEPKLSNRVAQSSGPNEDTNVRDNDLHSLLWREDHRVGVKV